MLSLLHDDIAKIIPIECIYKNWDGNIEISYKESPNEDQIIQINELINNWSLKEKKLEKLKKINNEWQNIENSGWDSELGYSLGITPNDVALLSGAYALAKEADNLGLPLPKFIAMDNSTIIFNNLSEMTQLLLRYGEARATLASSFANKRKAVESATTIDELDSI